MDEYDLFKQQKEMKCYRIDNFSQLNLEVLRSLNMILIFQREIDEHNFNEDFWFDLGGEYFGSTNEIIRFTVSGRYMARVRRMLYCHILLEKMRLKNYELENFSETQLPIVENLRKILSLLYHRVKSLEGSVRASSTNVEFLETMNSMIENARNELQSMEEQPLEFDKLVEIIQEIQEMIQIISQILD